MPYLEGGFTPRYVVSKADGTPCAPDARYFVLNVNGSDRHAALALRVYAASVRAENPTLADDLEVMLGRVVIGGVWPPEMAQHKDAK